MSDEELKKLEDECNELQRKLDKARRRLLVLKILRKMEKEFIDD